MKEINLTYRVSPHDQSTPVSTENFSGTCGYSLDRDPEFASFWDEKHTLILPRHAIVFAQLVD